MLIQTANMKQKGFTLIELMIVIAIIAIIGILAAFAIPAYQDYTARAQMGEALQLAGAQKLAVAEYQSSEGKWPADNGEAGVAAKGNITGKYVKEVEITNGVIKATMKDTGVSSGIKSVTLTLTPKIEGVTGTGADTDTTKSGSYTWTCTSSAEDKYLPTTCRKVKDNT